MMTALELYRAAEGIARCTGSVGATYERGDIRVTWHRRNENADHKHVARTPA